MLGSHMWAFFNAMVSLNIEQQRLTLKILLEYLNKNVSHRSPLFREIEEIIKIIEAHP